MSSATTTTVDLVVDINILKKTDAVIGKGDASSATDPTSCDSLNDSPSCSDGESVEGTWTSSSPLPSPVAETKAPTRRVSFSYVVVREFPRCLGDNPSVTEGPPLSIGWNPCHEYTKDVEAYEQQRDEEVKAIYAELAETTGQAPKKPRRRRKPFEFGLPCRERIMILHWECGSKNEMAQAAGTVCTGGEIKNMIRDTQRTRSQRRTTNALLQFEDTILKFEGASRKFRKMIKGRRKSKQEQAELDRWSTANKKGISMTEDSCRLMKSPLTKSSLKVAKEDSDLSDSSDGGVDV